MLDAARCALMGIQGQMQAGVALDYDDYFELDITFLKLTDAFAAVKRHHYDNVTTMS